MNVDEIGRNNFRGHSLQGQHNYFEAQILIVCRKNVLTSVESEETQ